MKYNIVRVELESGLIMLFGNSYKPWHMQLDEYAHMLRNHGEWNDLVSITASESKWIGWGGLKWCPEDRMQYQLNREGSQYEEPDNPNPRQYSDMHFIESDYITRRAKRIFKGARP